MFKSTFQDQLKTRSLMYLLTRRRCET